MNYDVWYSGQRGGHNLSFTLFFRGARSYRFGVQGIGAGSLAVLQVGGRLNEVLKLARRIYESEVGLSLDYRTTAPLTSSLGAYSVNLFTLDVGSNADAGRAN